MDALADPADRQAWAAALRQDRVAVESMLRRALQAALGHAYRIEDLHCLQFRRTGSRRAGEAFSVVLRTALRESITGLTATVTWHGGTDWPAFGAGAAAATGVDTGAGSGPGNGLPGWIPPVIGPVAVELPSLDAALWARPNDPALPQLVRLLSPQGMREALPATWRDASRVASVKAGLISQSAGRHAVLRADVTLTDGSVTVLVGKTFAGDKAQRVHARAQALWAYAEREPHAPRVARPLGLDADTATVWYEFLPGQTLQAMLEGPQAEAALMATGRALAAVHDLPMNGEGCRDAAHWSREVERRARKLTRLLPPLAGRVRGLADGLLAVVPRLPRPELTGIHGDCQPGQFMIDEGRATVLDFDSMALGMPMEDLAECLCKLHALPLPGAEIAWRIAALERAYVLAAPSRYAHSWLRWHEAVQALLAGTRCAQGLEPQWPERVAQWLGVGERALAALQEPGMTLESPVVVHRA